MFNLIPPRGKKIVKYEYYLRVGGTLALLFAGVFLLLTVALVPTYVLLEAQIKALESEQQQSAEDEDIFQVADREVTLTREMLAQLKRAPRTKLPSTVISEIRDIASPTITLHNFTIASEVGVVETVQIQGQAPTREVLAGFKSALEESALFDSVTLPIADLARDENLPFAITITLEK